MLAECFAVRQQIKIVPSALAIGGIFVAIESFEDLFVWQKADALVQEIYRLVEKLPKREAYGLRSQITDAAVSITSNIAEGHDRGTTKEYLSFLYNARGSNSEVKSQLKTCVKVGYLSWDEAQVALDLTDDVGKLLNRLIKSLKDKL